MNRTYNFQVDNGLFVAEYYLKKDYKDITVEDLKNNLEILSEKVYAVNEIKVLGKNNKLTRISSTSHNNSALSQPAYEKNRKEKIGKQLELLLSNIGKDKVCVICGEKRVNVNQVVRIDKNKEKEHIPYSSLMFGLPSHASYINRGNNLKTVDVCPVCLFFSMLSILNTQKISFPFVYMSDSDEFMRDITAEIQEEVAKKIMLDIKSKDAAEHLIPILTELMDKKEEGEFEGLNYLGIIQYSKGQSNKYIESEISKKNLDFIRKVKYRGLINEFYTLGLFWQIMKSNNLYNYLTKINKVISLELYEMIKGVSMNKEEIRLIETLALKLVEHFGVDKIIKDLKLVKKQEDIRGLLIDYTKEVDLGLTLVELNKVIQKYQSYRDYITLEIQTKYNVKKEEEK